MNKFNLKILSILLIVSMSAMAEPPPLTNSVQYFEGDLEWDDGYKSSFTLRGDFNACKNQFYNKDPEGHLSTLANLDTYGDRLALCNKGHAVLYEMEGKNPKGGI